MGIDCIIFAAWWTRTEMKMPRFLEGTKERRVVVE